MISLRVPSACRLEGTRQYGIPAVAAPVENECLANVIDDYQGESRKGVEALRIYETGMIGFLELVSMAKHGLRMQWQEHIFESARFFPPRG